ncbi:MAG TPA: CdaR family protein [Candidatus Limnocylindrales bacterium]
MNARRLGRRVVGVFVHNWPLKVAAIVLAALLYVGLVATQDSATFPGPIQVTDNPPTGTLVVNSPLRPVDEVRYIAPSDLGRLTASDFIASVDLSGLQPTGAPTSVRVEVTAVDPRVTILDWRPRSIQVTLDQEVTAQVPVTVSRGPAPAGAVAGQMEFTPQEVTVRGPSTAVKRVVGVHVDVQLDSSIDFDRELQGTPVDASGAAVTGVVLTPRTVHVTIPMITNQQSRTVPVNAVFTGTPAPGFRVAGVQVAPLTVTLQGDAGQLVSMSTADTAPISVEGATRDVVQKVALALPPGVTPVEAGTVSVTAHIEAVTETRTYQAGLRLDGGDPNYEYGLLVQSVLLTVFGSSADLDRLGSAPITVSIDVSGLAPGKHQLTVIPTLPSAVTVVTISPVTVTVTVVAPPSAPPSGIPPSQPTPSPTAPPTPAPS